MERKNVRYLVRLLTVEYDGRKDKVFPLALVSAVRDGMTLRDSDISPFKGETASTLYVSTMLLRYKGDGVYEIISEC